MLCSTLFYTFCFFSLYGSKWPNSKDPVFVISFSPHRFYTMYDHMLLKYVVADSQIDFLSTVSWLGFCNPSAPELSFWLRICGFEWDEEMERRKELCYWRATELALEVELYLFVLDTHVQFYPRLIQPIVHDSRFSLRYYRVTCRTIWAFLFIAYR